MNPDDPNLGVDVAELIRRNAELAEENSRLRLSIALLQWNPPKKRGGRKIKHTQQSEEEFFDMVHKLGAHFGITGRGALPKLCRILNAQKPLSERLSKVKLEEEIKTLQNRRSIARKP